MSTTLKDERSRLLPERVSKAWVRQFLRDNLIHRDPDLLFGETLLDLCYSLMGEGAGVLEVEDPLAGKGRRYVMAIGSLPVGVAAYSLHRYLLKKRSVALDVRGSLS